jgi:6-phosphogluconate dehydrogenase
MQLGMIGLGRMGGNMAKRLDEHGHDVKTFDPQVDSTAATLEELRDQLDAPRTFWMMVPAGRITEETFQTLLGLAARDDVIVDGGNSNFRDSQRRYEAAKERGIGFVDAGVSGGIWGLSVGYCLMVGGDDAAVAQVEPVFTALAPEDGYAHVGAAGAGHFTKMVHNGIEYGLMQAYAEGYELLLAKDTVHDVHGCFKAWTRGTVVRSWLLDLLVKALEPDQKLSAIKGYAEDSGEGRWTVEEAINNAVPMPVISAALFARFSSRQEDSPAMKAVAALRNQFGGHAVTAAGPTSGTGEVEGAAAKDVDTAEAAHAGPSSGTGATR